MRRRRDRHARPKINWAVNQCETCQSTGTRPEERRKRAQLQPRGHVQECAELLAGALYFCADFRSRLGAIGRAEDSKGAQRKLKGGSQPIKETAGKQVRPLDDRRRGGARAEPRWRRALSFGLVFTRIRRLASAILVGDFGRCQLSKLAKLALPSGEKSPLNLVGMPDSTLAFYS